MRHLKGSRVYRDVEADGRIVGLTEKGYSDYKKSGTYDWKDFVGYKKSNPIKGEKKYYK